MKFNKRNEYIVGREDKTRIYCRILIQKDLNTVRFRASCVCRDATTSVTLFSVSTSEDILNIRDPVINQYPKYIYC